VASNGKSSKLKIDRSPAPTRRRRRWPWLATIAVVAIGGGWFVLQPRAVSVQTTRIVTAYPSQQFVVLNSTGYVVAQRKAAISSKASGRLEWLGVTEGTRVKAGELIARLDARDVAAQLDAALANVNVARAALEQAEAENRDAAVSLKRAQVAVDYTQIRAPFDGIILSRSANVGDLVMPFSSTAYSKGAVVSMADMSTLEVDAAVSESSLSKISAGQPVEITLDALPGARFRGTVSRMVPTIDRAEATVMTEVRFDAIDARVLPEMSAKVSFLSQPITAESRSL
jgi:HlyD family secretion protein